jgi:hypothetical protein
MHSLIVSGVLMFAAADQVEGPEPPPALPGAYFGAADRPDAPQWKGTGLLVSGGVLGGLGLITNVVRIGTVQGLCKDLTYDTDSAMLGDDGTLRGVQTCVNASSSLLVLGPTALSLNATAFGLIAGGGAVHGRWAAYESVHQEAGRRRGGVQLGLGIVITTAALAGYAVTRVASLADVFGAQTCLAGYPADPADRSLANAALADCVRTRWTGYLAGITASQSAGLLGVGLLAHGAGYLRHTRLYRKARAHAVRLQPSLTPTLAGLTLTGRF